MIRTELDVGDLPSILAMGYTFHQESRYKDLNYDPNKIEKLLLASLNHPDKIFFAYDSSFNGLILLQMGTQFFSDDKWAGDQAFYVTPNKRGTRLALELLELGAKWAKENGAKELVILHNAGLGLESAEKFYTKHGFGLSGLIFNKQVN